MFEPLLNALATLSARTVLAATGQDVVPEYRRLKNRLAGIAASGADHMLAQAPGWDTESPMDALVGWLRQEHPEYAHEFDLLRLCGGQLAGILRGEIDSRQLIFGGEAFQALSDFYHDSPTSRFYNEIMAGCVAGMTEDAHDQLSVVEIGAGTGATTAALLPLVGGKIARYTFTDVSRFFLRRAEGRFGANAAMDFATLDIERDPRAQGFDALADVVVAANVVHATSDLRQTLTHMRGLLAPGGTLVLSEVTRRSAWLDLIFGVFDGWWRFADLDLRPDHPLLTAGSWRQVLHECGFDPGVTVADPDREGGTQASVIMAAKPADAEKRSRPAPGRRPVRRWIVLADRRGVGVLIAGRLTRLGDIVRVIHTPAHAWANAGMNGLAEEITQEAPDVGVIHAWSLDAPVGESVSSCELMDWQQTVCASALGLASVVSPVTQIAFVTSGAQAVPGDVSLPNVAQSPLWGLGRVMITENAGAVCRLIDIGAEPGEADVDAVVRELESGDGEQEIVIRGARRYVREVYRLGAATGENHQPVLARPGEGDSLGIAVRSPGALDSLELAEMPKTRPGPDEVAIRVMATGLNFRSVLLALGMLPGIAMGSDEVTRVLGTEYAGEVVAVGEDVKALQVGDEVVALASGALGSHAVARAKLALPKPPNLTWEEAASIPSAFMTAEYTLGRLAALAPGERVLIHSATGAVGLAALDVARRTGAEVFATAGSQEKRQLLQSMGIEHVMDSRSPGWAQDVLERTGGAGVDVILNSLGGEAIRKGLGILRPYGRFVEIGKRDIFQNAAVGLLPFRRNLSFFAFDLVGLGVERPDVAAALLRDVLDRSAAGEARPLPLTVFDLSESEQAFRLMAQARHVGKIVLTVNRAEYPVRASGQAPLFRADASYLIVGGLGGFGLKVAEWMANAGAGTLVLMTRSGMPKEDPAALRRLREGGTARHRGHR